MALKKGKKNEILIFSTAEPKVPCKAVFAHNNSFSGR